MTLVLVYYCFFTPLSIWWGIALTKTGWNEYLVLFFTMIINLITEFLWNRFVVYRNSINTAKTQEQKTIESQNINSKETQTEDSNENLSTNKN